MTICFFIQKTLNWVNIRFEIKMKFFNLTKRKILHLIAIAVTCFIIINIYKISFRDDTKTYKNGKIIEKIQDIEFHESFLTNNFMIPLKKERINELFSILLKYENVYKKVFQDLDIMMFTDIIEKKTNKFTNEISDYFQIFDKKLQVTDKFINDLKYLSNYYSYIKPRNNVQPKDITVSIYL